jgi:hypothetical protein
VHCVRLSSDGHFYVVLTIQVFKKDGAFMKEFQVEPQTLQNGSVRDLVLPEDSAQRYVFVADGATYRCPPSRSPDRLEARHFRPPGPHGRQLQHGHRLEGHHLHCRGRRRPPRAKVQT